MSVSGDNGNNINLQQKPKPSKTSQSINTCNNFTSTIIFNISIPIPIPKINANKKGEGSIDESIEFISHAIVSSTGGKLFETDKFMLKINENNVTLHYKYKNDTYIEICTFTYTDIIKQIFDCVNNSKTENAKFKVVFTNGLITSIECLYIPSPTIPVVLQDGGKRQSRQESIVLQGKTYKIYVKYKNEFVTVKKALSAMNSLIHKQKKEERFKITFYLIFVMYQHSLRFLIMRLFFSRRLILQSISMDHFLIHLTPSIYHYVYPIMLFLYLYLT